MKLSDLFENINGAEAELKTLLLSAKSSGIKRFPISRLLVQLNSMGYDMTEEDMAEIINNTDFAQSQNGMVEFESAEEEQSEDDVSKMASKEATSSIESKNP